VTQAAVNILFIFFAQRRAHAPLVAGAEDTYGFGVVVTGYHLNRTATSGCVARLVRLSYDSNSASIGA
jgi:hypothetical protein